MVSTINAHVYVHTAFSSFMPGNEISGTISIEILQTIDADNLVLTFKGLEMTHWVEYSNMNRRIKRNQIRHQITSGNSYAGNKTCFEQSWVVHKFNGSISPGHITLPFSINLPDDLSPSFTYNELMKATRYYIIKAELNKATRIRAHQNVINITSYSNELQRNIPISVSLSCVLGRCWCFSKQQVSMSTMNLEKNSYCMNEVIKGLLVVDHTLCTKKLHKIRFKLKRSIKVEDNSNKESILDQSVSVYDSIVNFVNKPEVKMPFQFSFDLMQIGSIAENPTCESYLIRCHYDVCARLMYDSSTTGSKCEISASVHIYSSFPNDLNDPSPLMLQQQSSDREGIKV